MFFCLKDYAIRKKRQKGIVIHLTSKRNYRIQKLGWSVWKFFLRMRDEKTMYKMSLLRYALMRRAKKMLAAWNLKVLQRKRENKLSLQIKDCQQKWRKARILRLL